MDIKNFTNIEFSKDIFYKNFLKKAYKEARKSTHPSTHVCALLIDEEKILLSGINILPEGVKPLPDRFEEEKKHIYLNHAERDVFV